MKVSLDWLKDYYHTSLDVSVISKTLTDSGLEIEKVAEVQEINGGLKGVVVGEVVKKWPHPNADRLNVAEVNIGLNEPLQIVCGAPNLEQGQKVMVSTIGTTLYPLNGEPFKIKKGKIRGELSEGMICGEDEIGVGPNTGGIMVLDSAIAPGTPGAVALDLRGDTTLEIGLTPNRTDAMGHYGVARDLAVALKYSSDSSGTSGALKMPPFDLLQAGTESSITLEIKSPKLCPRYTGVVIDQITVAPSPDWLQKRLRIIGLEPINNVVDITNYVLHEFGHPLHAFDMTAIKDKTVVVKTLSEGTKFTTLDGKERSLSAADLMICSGASLEPMCIAGVFGGEHSGVSNSTTSIFLESAAFNSVSVRKTAKRHTLSTDASFRFERGVDPDFCLTALSRAASLILELAGGTISGKALDHYPGKEENTSILFSPSRCNELIGFKLPEDTIEQILIDLDFSITKDGDKWNCNAPKYRVDVTREADIIEEVLRIYGYNNVPMPAKLNSSLSYFHGRNEEQLRNKVADLLASQGFYEMMSNSLTKAGHSEISILEAYGEPVSLLNPLSQDLGEMRTSLAYNMLSAVQHNINRKSSNLRLFEFGNVYAKAEQGYKEKLMLGLAITGLKSKESWNNQNILAEMPEVLSGLENVLSRLNVTYTISQEEGMAYFKKKKNVLAVARKATVEELAHFGISQPVYFGFIEWNEVLRAMNSEIKYETPSKFPEVTRDLSLLLDDTVTFSNLEKAGKNSGGSLVRSVNLFDVYEGKKLPAGKKSYAIRFVLSDPSKTLDDKTIEKTMNKILKSYEYQFKAELR
ncbi:MAG: phenylalanine--tRNA ligase subunit beta [Flavobacteriales bacterium]